MYMEDDSENENEIEIAGVLMNIKNSENIDGIFDYSSSNNKCFKVFVKKRDRIMKYFVSIYIKDFKIENLIFKTNMEENEININYINNFYIWYVINSIDNIDSKQKKDSFDLNKTEDNIYSKENEDYYLSKNDILKFGNVKYIVKEIHIEYNDKNLNNNNTYLFTGLPGQTTSNRIFNLNHICKAHKYCEFCKGLMVVLCKCNEFEHFNCIKDWINDRIITRENEIVNSYYFNIFKCKEYISRKCNEEKCEKDYCCQKCNTYYPLYFKLDQNENLSEEEKKE